LKVENFTAAMLRYSKVQPYCAPDFSDLFVAEFWFDQLGHYDVALLGTAMRKLCAGRRFPSIEQIKTECGDVTVTDEDIAKDTAERIFAAVSRFGSTQNSRWEAIAESIGEVGVLVVGGPAGYKIICDQLNNNNASTFKAQWRELAKAKITMKRAGIDGPAQLPASSKEVTAALQEASKGVAEITDGSK
jgi:hypothetical protein